MTTSGGIGRTTICSILARPSTTPISANSTTYSGIKCPRITSIMFSAGTYTLRFSQPNVNGIPSISSRVFIVVNPTFITDTVATITTQTATASAIPSSTSTVTEYRSTTIETPAPGEEYTTIVTNKIQDCFSSLAVSSSASFSSSSV
ncbi:hypothetical protein P154DRAFT_605847 [Amniculicola lignicola CBS 123094]|uniref:Uncharacterized protein n=1 Tax=Amniculicola lignicola CBS 123094 TaxID=1392246 RepID=A0A6A5W6K4_9PLEO|nr:hypothetical protein P154DRAFT_605847 [Amniculicola lignicola CBS 123094]